MVQDRTDLRPNWSVGTSIVVLDRVSMFVSTTKSNCGLSRDTSKEFGLWKVFCVQLCHESFRARASSY